MTDNLCNHKSSCNTSSCGVGCCGTSANASIPPDAPKTSLPPNAFDMLKITLGLCLACAISAFIAGFVFVITEPVKQQNLKSRENTMIRQLLNLSNNAEILEIRRYLLWKDSSLEIIYLTPNSLVHLDSAGNEISVTKLPDNLKKNSMTEEEKNLFVTKTLNDTKATYSGRFFAGKSQGSLIGYVVEGTTLGFKAHIRFFMALNKDFGIRGVEIVQHEEDPGLGAEIAQKYFKNQFTGRSAKSMASTSVIKDPLPNDWREVVESLGKLTYEDWISQYSEKLKTHPNIYAITGSTISSTAVTNGVKNTVENFIKRMKVLEPYL